MIRINEPGVVLLYDGRLARVIGIAEGRTICLRFVEEAPCATCGHQPGIDLLEHAPLFQDHVQPVATVGEAATKSQREQIIHDGLLEALLNQLTPRRPVKS